jgi:hypothetical protein
MTNISTLNSRIQRDQINREDLHNLISTQEPNCISIYIPTHIKGEEVLQGHDAKTLEVEVRKVRKALEHRSCKPGEIEERLDPVTSLLKDGSYWREQSNGLVVFSSKSWFKTFRVPVSFEPGHHVGNRFYLLPLIPVLMPSSSYYLLSLELERIRLFRGSDMGIAEVNISDMVPQRKEDRVGYDYEQKSLQFRSQHQAHSAAGFHGHAEADRDRKDEIARFFREVDQGLQTFFKESPAPLIIASQKYLAAIFKGVTTYKEVIPEILIENLSEVSDTELHQKALNLLTPIANKEQERKWKLLLQYLGSGKASTNLELILEAVREGSVDTLFINRKAATLGSKREAAGAVVKVSEEDAITESLVNHAVIGTLKTRGMVYLTSSETMPGNAEAAALLRY